MLARLRNEIVIVVAVAAAVLANVAAATEKNMRAIRINPHAPNVDGRLNDAIWQRAEFFGDFIQREPNEGEAAKNQTQIAVAYDDHAVYIAARMFNVKPDDIVSTVSRRDKGDNSERVIVSLDTYNNERTAYTFAVTATGTRIDYFHGSDQEGDRDYEFNPVWEAKTARTPDGWSAEMRIPFTQLRFRSGETQVWGININRWVPTDNEDSYWILVPKDETGWSSRMGDLVGIEGVVPSRRLEVMPYAASDVTVASEIDPDDPFADKENFNGRVGGDFKMGIGPNLTLEATINPDFGQVEADPAEVNLSAFETFFSERRPFFTEGADLLRSTFFYSRRIGARPHLDPEGDYFDAPQNTTILGAAKLTGRLNSGLSIGVLAALTDEEKTDVFHQDTGTTERVSVEPMSGYGIVRLQQEFGEHQSTAGVTLTGVGRDFESRDLRDILRREAYGAAADWNLRFKGGDYELEGQAGFTHVKGSEEAIEDAQRSSARYLQRPDNDHTDLDPTRTSLTGWKAYSEFQKNAGDWVWSAGGAFESPLFEPNDLGQLSTADDIDTWLGGRYRQNTAGDRLQNWWVGTWVGTGWNFGGTRQYHYIDMEASMTFKSFNGLWGSAEFFPGAYNDHLTRGGPLMATPNSWNFDLNWWSNYKGKTSWWWFVSYDGDDNGGWDYYGTAGVTFRPGSRWQLSFEPAYRREVNPRQYVDTIEGSGPAATYGDRYVFAFIERSQFTWTTRLNYSFTPDLSLEFYAEPFAASGRYYDHGELVAAREDELRTYGSDGTSIAYDADDEAYTVTDGAETFSFDNVDFNFVSLRTNFVLRWEWSPGSTLFFVWQQNRSGFDPVGDIVGFSNLGDAITAEGDNFFALKLTYWVPFL